MSIGIHQVYYIRQCGKNRIFSNYSEEVEWLHTKLLLWSRLEKGKNVLEWHKFRWLIGAGLKIKKNYWRQVLNDLEVLGVIEKTRKFAVIAPLREVKNDNVHP